MRQPEFTATVQACNFDHDRYTGVAAFGHRSSFVSVHACNAAGSSFFPRFDCSTIPVVENEISEREFLRLRNLVHEEAGLWLSQAKSALLVGRLAKRLRHHGLKSFKQYYDLVINSPEESIQMLNALSTNETRFFREPQHFELLKSVIFPKWAEEAATGYRNRKIRVLSAGCSTGQEPYSLAMVLLDRFPGWEIEIIATDLSTRALEIARAGILARCKGR